MRAVNINDFFVHKDLLIDIVLHLQKKSKCWHYGNYTQTLNVNSYIFTNLNAIFHKEDRHSDIKYVTTNIVHLKLELTFKFNSTWVRRHHVNKIESGKLSKLAVQSYMVSMDPMFVLNVIRFCNFVKVPI